MIKAHDPKVNSDWLATNGDRPLSPVFGDTLLELDTLDEFYFTGEGWRDTSVTTILSSIAATGTMSKTSYVEGETISLAGLTVTATYSDETTETVTESCTAVPAKAVYGVNTIKVRYVDNGIAKYVDKTITVSKRVVSSIAVTTNPTKTTYNVGDKFDPTGMVVTATYNDSSTEIVSDYTYTPYVELAYGDTITISYAGKTTTLSITVNRVAKSITITTPPTTTTYTAGQSFDATGMVVTARYTDDATAVVTSSCTVTVSDPLTVEDTEAVISYTAGGVTVTASQAITVTA